ncbi:MAG: sensor histidine kinase [Alphaproteobacteria bacterium]|nr:sensor histidine kinase [Alphaproteobacteria bacterium]
MPRTLFGKLVVVLLALLLATSVFYVALTVTATRLHIQEVTQNLHRDLAADLLKDRPLMTDGKADSGALKKVFEMLMVVNPSIELYLIDPQGQLLAFSAAPGKVKREKVSLAPIQAFLTEGRKLPIRGDDPRDLNQRKIFSVAPVMEAGQVSGYLYVVLGGEIYDSINRTLEASWITRISAGLAIASLLLVTVIGILSIKLLTRRLKRLTGQLEAFKRTDPEGVDGTEGDVGAGGGQALDEIDELALTFEAMSARIDDQIGELERSDSMRRELITNISHDLRTPLASLQGAIETLQIKDQSLSAADKNRYLELAHSHCQRLGRLITDLFDLATLESHDRELHFEPFSLAELVQDVAQKFQPLAARNGLTLKLDIRLNTSLVSADIALIERVLTNLADNAIKYTPAGGTVEMGVARADERIIASVADTGQGIPARELSRVFDRPYRVEKNRGDGTEGAGLGLAIAQRILRLHGGHLDVKSTLGAGSAFSFGLDAV